MKVSVITVSFNSAATIVKTLLSVASQSHEHIEHIVIDGGSTDGTVALVQSNGTHVARFISESDRGIYDAMNKGLRCATGDIVGFLNADDRYADVESVSRIVRAFEAEPAPDIVYGDLEYVLPDRDQRIVRYWRGGEFVRAGLARGWMPPHPTFYIRRSLAMGVGEFNTSYRIAADYDFMVRCLVRRDVQVRYLPTVIVCMSLGGASNASIGAMLRKSREDFRIVRRNHIGGLLTLTCKNLRKVPQFLARRRTPGD